jgi:indolepyruvate ferredoxin oxidoreductase beta subunit
MLLSSVFGEVCAKTGTHIVTGEQHGLSQRSGSISVHLRIGADALSPLIPYGEADLAIAMEATEALRYLEYLREGAPIVMSSRSSTRLSKRLQSLMPAPQTMTTSPLRTSWSACGV